MPKLIPPPTSSPYSPEAVEAFKAEIVEVCRKHRLSISHQDCQGAFEIVPLQQEYLDWFMPAELIER